MKLTFGILFLILAGVSLAIKATTKDSRFDVPTWSLLVLANIWFAANMLG